MMSLWTAADRMQIHRLARALLVAVTGYGKETGKA